MFIGFYFRNFKLKINKLWSFSLRKDTLETDLEETNLYGILTNFWVVFKKTSSSFYSPRIFTDLTRPLIITTSIPHPNPPTQLNLTYLIQFKVRKVKNPLVRKHLGQMSRMKENSFQMIIKFWIPKGTQSLLHSCGMLVLLCFMCIYKYIYIYV